MIIQRFADTDIEILLFDLRFILYFDANLIIALSSRCPFTNTVAAVALRRHPEQTVETYIKAKLAFFGFNALYLAVHRQRFTQHQLLCAQG